jgi:hypothetical protein
MRCGSFDFEESVTTCNFFFFLREERETSDSPSLSLIFESKIRYIGAEDTYFGL